jgi:hypothetical protein
MRMVPRSKVTTTVLTLTVLILIGSAAWVAVFLWDRQRSLAIRDTVDPAFGYFWDVAPDALAVERIVAELDKSLADRVAKADMKVCSAILEVDQRDPFIRDARLVIEAFSSDQTLTLYDGPVMDAIDLRIPSGADVSGTPKAYAIAPQHLRSTYWITKNSFNFACDGRPLRIRLHGPAAISSAQPDAIQILRN